MVGGEGLEPPIAINGLKYNRFRGRRHTPADVCNLPLCGLSCKRRSYRAACSHSHEATLSHRSDAKRPLFGKPSPGEKLVRRHPNIFMTVNGHVLNDGLGFLTSKGDAGNNVHQILVNYQMLPVGGETWLRILSLRPDGKAIQVQDYSPLYDRFNTNPDNQFVINL